MLDKLNIGDGNTPRSHSLFRQTSQISVTSKDSETLKYVKEQIKEIREGKVGGEKPETKYLNKKKEFVKQLFDEKQQAIERGVKEKVVNLESNMIDEMMQMALNIDIEAEIEKRVQLAKKISEFADESISKSGSFSKFTKNKSNKKNVKFEAQTNFEQSILKSDAKESKSIGDSMIDENIDIIESQQFNNSSNASKVIIPLTKIEESSQIEGKKEIKYNKSDSSLERINEDDQVSYSNDFANLSPSVSQSDKQLDIKSNNILLNKVVDIEESGYTETFEEQSLNKSQQKRLSADKLGGSQIEVVKEEEDDNSLSKSSKQDQKNQQLKELVEQSVSDIDDREILNSTNSVDW